MEANLLFFYSNLTFYNLQGSHWAPHLIKTSLWEKIGGFSIEFDPGFGSDPDLNMKLWNLGVRIFKGVNKSRVYHFGSLTTRKKNNIIRNNGRKTFLLKWKLSIDLFIKFYLRRGTAYKGPLENPNMNISYFFSLIKSRVNYYVIKLCKRN